MITCCSKCSKETNSHYLVRQRGILCGECAKEDGNKEIEQLQKDVKIIENQILDIGKEIWKAVRADCKHHFIDTGYGRFTDGKLTIIQYCTDCGEEIEI